MLVWTVHHKVALCVLAAGINFSVSFICAPVKVKPFLKALPPTLTNSGKYLHDNSHSDKPATTDMHSKWFIPTS
eukprot:1500364-Amphidinium_carterae.1